jgi:hypothetical protein
VRSLIRTLRTLTLQLAADTSRPDGPKTWEHGQRLDQWDLTLLEILRETVRATREGWTPPEPVDASEVVPPLVGAVARLAESSPARDVAGDRSYDDAKENLSARLLDFAHAMAVGRPR